MHQNKGHIRLITIIQSVLLILLQQNVSGQVKDSVLQEAIAVTARPSPDSITLRWAPLHFNIWKAGNERGYRVERYVVSRGGALLPVPEKTVLRPALKPASESQWIPLVQQNKYAAIAAQALFGERFEIDLRQSDVLTVVNKVRENEQRFAFALFSADMVPAVARASGLWFTDHSVAKSEKYLYRILLNGDDTIRGSIFVGPDDPYELPCPSGLQAEFKDNLVSLKWRNTGATLYSAFIVERSKDGKVFQSISESAMTTIAPTAGAHSPYEYAVDSLADPTIVYHYRIRGITPFGEVGPPSDAVSGKAIPRVEQVPFIISAVSPDNRVIDVHWDFPERNNNAIKGFDVRRAAAPDGNYKSLTKDLLPPQQRTFIDRTPDQSNYYKVMALGLDDEWYTSHLYYAQLIDSIPPLRPTGLKADVNEEGEVTLTWRANEESDIYGYRIYKAYHKSEELAQVTTEPTPTNTFKDAVDLNTLNEHVYYRVMSIDRNQNHSALSELLQVALPDKVNPQPPVLAMHKTDHSGFSLSWRPGASRDIVKYKVYRSVTGTTRWMEHSTVDAGTDSMYTYHDTTMVPGEKHFYTVIAIDKAGLESRPTAPVAGSIPITALRPAVVWKKHKLNREENTILLAWDYPEQKVQTFRIYRSADEEPMVMFDVVGGNEKSFLDKIIPGKTYRYRLMALFEDGQKSSLSEELRFTY